MKQIGGSDPPKNLMVTYTYIAKSLDGQTQEGELVAENERQLAQNLKNQGMVLVRAVARNQDKKLKIRIKIPFLRVSLSEKILMTRNIGIMFATGLSLVKCFEILTSQSKNPKLKAALLDIKDKISKGENLSDALSYHPDIFSELYVSMVKIGEEAGTLDEIFQILSLQLTKEHELKSKIRNAMIYPSIILLVMVAVGVIVVTFVLPNLSLFFTSLNVEIPVYTKILLAGGDFLSKQWYLLIIVPLFSAALFWLIIRTKNGKKMMDTILLRLFIISAIVKKNNSALLIRSLSSLIASGVSLVRSLEISSKTIANFYFAKAMLESSEKVKKGEKLSASLKPYQHIFPLGVVEMIEVGEETGKTSDILRKLADFYEQEAVVAIERLTIMIEPILIIILGVAVGFFAVSVIEPMYSSLQSII